MMRPYRAESAIATASLQDRLLSVSSPVLGHFRVRHPYYRTHRDQLFLRTSVDTSAATFRKCSVSGLSPPGRQMMCAENWAGGSR